MPSFSVARFAYRVRAVTSPNPEARPWQLRKQDHNRRRRDLNAQVVLTLTGERPPLSASPARHLLIDNRRNEKPAELSPAGTEEAGVVPRRHKGGVSMKHSSSRQLYAYWEKQRGTRPAPDRADIDPASIRHALGDTFMLAADFVDEQRYRLAGTRICALFGRELKGESFSASWTGASRDQLVGMMTELDTEHAGFVAGVTARNAKGAATGLELLLLPLAHRGHARVRAIGVLAATDLPYWIGDEPIAELALGTVRHIGPETARPPIRTFTSATTGGQLRRGFMVYQGGLIDPPNEKAG